MAIAVVALFFSAALLLRSSNRSIEMAALCVLGALPSTPPPPRAEAPNDWFESMGSVTGRLEAFVDLG